MRFTFAGTQQGHDHPRRRRGAVLVGGGVGAVATAALVLPIVVMPPRVDAGVAGMVFVAPTLSAPQGSSGAFDLLIENASAGSLHLAAEGVQMGVAGSGVNFTDTTAATGTPYVFPDSFDVDNGFTLDASGVSYPKTDFMTTDLSNVPSSFIVMSPGQSLGVVHVSYSVDASAALGAHTLTFEDIGGGTSTSDEIGNAVPFGVSNGTLTVTAAVPEPATVGIGALAILLASGSRIDRRRRRRR